MSSDVRAPIDVYDEALKFQRTRTAMLSRDFYKREMDAARPRAFTITGLQQMEQLLAANRLVEQAIATNMPMSDFADRLGELVDEHGGTILPPSRFELIYHNAMVTTNAAGQWRQWQEFIKDRPYAQYQGPLDDRNSQICKPIHGLIVHYTDPVLKHFWHPNHHWERHAWESLSADDVDPKTVYRSPEGQEYPVIGGQVVRPALGWDFNPSDAMAAEDRVFPEAALELREQLTLKSADDYSLARLDTIASKELRSAPKLAQAVDIEDAASVENAWHAFQKTTGIQNEEGAWLLDYGKDGVRVNRYTFEASMTEDTAITMFFPLITSTLSDPVETWWVPYRRDGSETTFVKRYLGLFAAGKTKRYPILLDRTPEGWLWRIVAPADLEPYRVGLLINTKAARAASRAAGGAKARAAA